MNTQKENKFSMHLTSRDYLNANTAIVNPLPNFSTIFTLYQNAITQIQTSSEQQMFDRSGLAISKKQLKDALITLAADTSRRMVAYASFANNQTLLKEVKFTESDLKSAPDTILRDNAQGIYDRAQTNLTALAAYGITATTQTALLNAINAYIVAIPKPRIGVTTKKQSTEQLDAAFKNADAALKNIDTLIEIVKLSQPSFYKGYKTARKIVNNGTNYLAVKVRVTDIETGLPLKGVTVSFLLDGNTAAAKSAKPIIKKTAEKGGAYIKSCAAGLYKVTISKNGYVKQETTLAVSDGETSVLNIQLSKN